MKRTASIVRVTCLAVLVIIGAAPWARASSAPPQGSLSAINAQIRDAEADIAAVEAQISEPGLVTLREALAQGQIVFCGPLLSDWQSGGTALTTRDACTGYIARQLALGTITDQRAVELAALTGRLTRLFRKSLDDYVAELQERLQELKNRLSGYLDERARLLERQQRTDPKPPTRVGGGDAGGGGTTGGGGTAGGSSATGPKGYWVRDQPKASAKCPGMTASDSKIVFQDGNGSNELKWEGVPDSITGGTPVHITWTMTQRRGPWMEGGIQIDGSPQNRDEGGLDGGAKGLTTDARFPELSSGFVKFNWSRYAGGVVTIRLFAGNGGCNENVIWTYTKQQ